MPLSIDRGPNRLGRVLRWGGLAALVLVLVWQHFRILRLERAMVGSKESVASVRRTPTRPPRQGPTVARLGDPDVVLRVIDVEGELAPKIEAILSREERSRRALLSRLRSGAIDRETLHAEQHRLRQVSVDALRPLLTARQLEQYQELRDSQTDEDSDDGPED